MNDMKNLLLDISRLNAKEWGDKYISAGWKKIPSLEKIPQNIIMKDFLLLSEKTLKEEYSYEWEDIFLINKALQEVGLALTISEKELNTKIEKTIGRWYDFHIQVRVWIKNKNNNNKKAEKTEIKKALMNLLQNKDNIPLFDNEIDVTFI